MASAAVASQGIVVGDPSAQGLGSVQSGAGLGGGQGTGTPPQAPQTEEPVVIDLSSPASLLKGAATLEIFDPGVVKQSLRGTRQHQANPWPEYMNDISSLGAPASSLDLTSCYCIILLVDDSGSMRGHEGDVAAAVNAFLDDYKDAKKKGEIKSEVLVAVGGLNQGLFYPFTPILDAPHVSTNQCQANGGTPLYDVANTICSLQMAKATELQSFGIRAKTLSCLLTDGNDENSTSSAEQVAAVVRGLNGESKNHIVSGIYLGNANRSTFANMGIPDEWILSGGSPKDLMATFSRLSKMSRSSLTAGRQGKKGIEVS